MVSVAAVIVTFNRLEKLRRVLQSVEEQTLAPSRVIILDNASTDGTADYLATRVHALPTEVVRMDRNVGGAGGFAEGMLRAYLGAADHAWIMDDDCYPAPDSLDRLVAGLAEAQTELGPEVPFACSVVMYTDGNICEMNNPVPTWDWARLLVHGQRNVMVTACSFVSVLVPRWAIAEFGLPYRDYFIWFDDREYTLRLTRRCPGVQVMDSIVVHDMGLNRGVNFSMVEESSVWKFEYGVRNEASWSLHHHGTLAFASFGLRVFGALHRGRVPLRLRWRIVRAFVRGVRFNPAVEFPGDFRQFEELEDAKRILAGDAR